MGVNGCASSPAGDTKLSPPKAANSACGAPLAALDGVSPASIVENYKG